MFVPSKMFFTRGKGVAREKLTSFEAALRTAGISQFNLVQVSSIFPPHCRLLTREHGTSLLQAGEITYCVMARNATNEPGRLIAAATGVAIPKDRTKYGYVSEHNSFGQTREEAGDYAEDLAASMLATILGVPFDPDKSYDERKELWKISHHIVRTMNITQTARGARNGDWTTVVAAAVFVK
ncbi:pyruvoyl-dependent arginine decarboxylase [candidate division BRC1 bacterium SM23_51]|nr:MAG: pyruvoyl-dependent arginine decarboxylase [candidate division BRC1 bacterium SM23_51]